MGDSDPTRSDEANADPERDGAGADAAGTATETSVPTADPSDAESDGDADGAAADSVDALRERVEEKYDFEEFGPAEMAEMSAEEWDAAFDPDTWITGADLLDRLATDLRARVAAREVFARVERHEDPQRVLAYSDEGYALVYPDGTVEGRGTVLRDVKPLVALCSMESYEVSEAPAGDPLPAPDEVPESGSELGNQVVQVVAAVQVLAGLAMLAGAFLSPAAVPDGDVGSAAVVIVAGVAFLLVGVLLFAVVANARLSEKFRAEAYRERLRAVGLDDGERPEFVPALEGEDGD